MNINSVSHLLETKWSVKKNTNGTRTVYINLGYQGSISTFYEASDDLRTLSNIHKYLRATAVLYFITREENVPFHRRPLPQAFLHPPSQRFHMAAMKGQGDPKKGLSVLKLTHSMAWLGFCTFNREKCTLYIHISAFLNLWWLLLPVFSPYSCANYFRHLREAGSPQRTVFGLVGFSLYYTQLQYDP